MMTENNIMQSWMDYQNNVFKSWQESMTAGSKQETQTNNNMFAQSTQPLQESFKTWLDFANNTYEKSLQQLGETNPLYKETIEKYAGITSFNNNLKKLWEDLNATITDKESDPFKFYTKWSEDYSKLVSSQLLFFMPEEVKNLYDKTVDIYKVSNSTTNDFFAPWMDQAKNMQDLLLKSTSGDQNANTEFLKIWQRTFSSSFGKIFNMPQFLMNAEQMQKQMSSVNAMITFISTLTEYNSTVANKSKETLEKVIKDYQAMVVEGTHPKSYKEFYEFWWKQNEASYLQLFGTEEFAKIIGQLLDAGVNFKRKYDDLLEKQLEFLPYPTKTDMDSVYKTLDSLKREIRSLKKEVAALKQTAVKPNSAKDRSSVKEG